MSIKDKELIANALGMHYVIYMSKAELDQLKEGMHMLGVLELLQKNSAVMRTFLNHSIVL